VLVPGVLAPDGLPRGELGTRRNLTFAPASAAPLATDSASWCTWPVAE
jgi:hypothetical protein